LRPTRRFGTPLYMVFPADYHMHTPLCRHAQGEPTEYAAHALKLGMREIGFSDHNPMIRDDYDDWHMQIAELDSYVAKVEQARADHPGLVIKLALEVDYLPGHEDWIRQLASRHPWDYFIGSVHYVSDSWDLDNPKKLDEWRARNAFDVWKTYFERLSMAAASGLFHIIGHTDLPKKFCFYPSEDCDELFSSFLTTAREHDVAIELNTAGLRKDCREIYPSRAILEKAFEMRVPITFGSDAHAPGEVGMDLEQAVILARSVGYTQWCRFTQGRRESVPLT
jgi:histidinol-phosphatase (PHP family)